MEEIRPIFKNPFFVLLMMKDHGEKLFRSKLKFDMTFGFPLSIDLGNHILFRGRNPQKLSYDGVILHKLNKVAYVFRTYLIFGNLLRFWKALAWLPFVGIIARLRQICHWYVTGFACNHLVIGKGGVVRGTIRINMGSRIVGTIVAKD
jgi:hypothetical protein